MAQRLPSYKPLSTSVGGWLGLGSFGQLVARIGTKVQNQIINITNPCVDATIDIGAENTNVRIITITLKDRFGRAITWNQQVDIGVYLDATPTDFVATGGSTGIAISTAGKLVTVLAKKLFKALSKNDGTIVLTWTDTGTEAFAIGVLLPTGRLVMSAASANT